MGNSKAESGKIQSNYCTFQWIKELRDIARTASEGLGAQKRGAQRGRHWTPLVAAAAVKRTLNMIKPTHKLVPCV